MYKQLLSTAIRLFFVFTTLQTHAYNLRHISGKDGLTCSSITSLGQKPDGTMLLGTIVGLYSYDGTQVWNSSQYDGLYIKGNIIEDVLCTTNQNTYILTNYGLNIIKNDGTYADFFSQFQGIRRIRKDNNNHITLLGNDGLYYQQVSGDFKKIRLNGIKSEDVTDYTFTNHFLYIFHRHGIIRYTISNNENQITVGNKRIVDNISISSAYRQNDAEYIVNQSGILFRYDLQTGHKRHLSSLSNEISKRGKVSDIIEFKGKIFISFSNHGILELDSQNGMPILTDIGIETGIFRMKKDLHENIIWIGTDGEGVYMYCDEEYSLRTLTHGNTNIDVSCPLRAILHDNTGTLWLGTKGNGLVALPHFDINKANTILSARQLNEHNSQLSSNVVYALSEHGTLGFWICGAMGVDYYSYTSKTIVPVKTEIPLQQVVAAQEYQGKLWITTLGFGIYKADIVFEGGIPRLTNIQNYVIENGKLSSNYFFCLTHDTHGNWWFGNRGKGLFLFKDGCLKHIQLDKKYKNPYINDVFSLLSVGEHLWIGTECGIIVTNKKGATKLIDMTQGLPGNTIRAIENDMANEIWVTTNAGIAALSSNAKVIRVYGKRSGIDVTEFCDGAISHYNNELYFGGVNGLVIIRQESLARNANRLSQLAFTTLHINGVQQNINNYLSNDSVCHTLTLSHLQNSFKIGVASLNYLSEPFNNYYYRFSSNDEWSDNGQENTFSFMYLPPGKHTLYIKYKNLSTAEESKIFKLFIVITPPWYRSHLAYFCYFLLFVCLSYWLTNRWHSRQKEKQAAELARIDQKRRDELFEEKLKFLTNVVHELNTPLTLIYGPCERILAHETNNKFVNKYIQQIIRNLSRLSALIQEIIDFRKITTGHHSINIKKVNVSALFNEYCDAFMEMAERHNIYYELQLEQGIIWNSDENALERIGGNLISNAFKYTKDGGTIKVNLSQVNSQIILSVYNTGAGISKDDQKRIFDCYSVFNNVEEGQNDEQTSRNGIGMAICYNITKELGGDVRIESEVGKYARFIVTLPSQQLPEGAPQDQEPINRSNMAFWKSLKMASTAENKKDLSKPKYLTGENTPTILVIDDHQEILDLLSDSLEEYHLLTAHNVSEGFERLKHEQPDLIITDLMMPGTNGLDFIQQIKQNKHTMHIPLIILSAKSSEEERIEGLESGADIYISKPFSIAYLQAAIKRMLENHNILKEYYNSPASAFSYSSGKLLSKENQEFMEKVTQLIEANLKNTDFTPEIMAEQLCISLRSLYRKFEKAQLPTPKEYIKTYKITAAAKLLTNTGMTIQEIIYSTGFNTRSQFYTEFRKHYGQTPRDYRNMYHSEDEKSI